MKIKGSFYPALFSLLIGLFGIIQSLTFKYFSAIFLPLLLSSIIFVLGVAETGRELIKAKKQEYLEEKLRAETGAVVQWRRFGLVSGWALGFSLIAFLLGFRIAIPFLALFYLKWRGRSWFTAIVFAVGILIFIYLAFELGLKAQLFKGLIFGGRE